MKIILYILFLMPFFELASDPGRRRELVRVVDEELKEVKRLNRQMRGRNPQTLLRVAELYLEKARLIRDAENERFQKMSYKQRRRSKKSKFFRQSRSYFSLAQKTCRTILKRHKRFKGKGDVYYIMAYNAKEFNQHKRAEKYFKLAIKSSKRNSVSHKKSQIALAEIYYNKKKYKKAIGLYERALSKNDKWWTKDALHLSWSYFRIKRTDKAIALMKEVGRRSKNGRYIDMSGAVDRDLEYFYTNSGRTQDVINLYKSRGKNVGEGLLEMAENSERKGKSTVAISLLEDALKYAKNDNPLKIKIFIALLPLYAKYGHEGKHFRVTKNLVGYAEKNQLDPEQKKTLIHQIKMMSALLQKQVASKKYKHNRKVRERKGQMSVAYFSFAEKVEKGQGQKHTFHAGETLYALGKYDQAVGKYMKALNIARKRNDKKLIQRSLDSLLATLGQKGVPRRLKDKYLEKVYLDHIKLLPRSKKNEKISERLFNHYMEKKDLAKAERTLKGYASLYPRKKSKHEAMIAKIMDHYRKVGDKKNFSIWMDKIRRGEYAVSDKYINQLRKIHLALEFEKVDQANKEGNKKKALQGYLAIYRSDRSLKEAKKNSAYNIAVLFRDLGHPKLTYTWTKNALNIMNTNDVQKYSATFRSLANSLFNQQEIGKAAEINEIILSKICKKRIKEKSSIFMNSATLYLAEEDFASMKRVILKGSRCKIEKNVLEEQKLALLKTYADKRMWPEFENEVKQVSASRKNHPLLIEFLDQYRRELEKNGRVDVAKNVKQRIYRYYKGSKNKYPIPVEGLDVMAVFELEKLEQRRQKFESIRLRFPEEHYNKTLQRKLKEIGVIEEKALNVMKIGSGIGIVRANRIIEVSYLNLSREIASFTPPGKSKEYIAGFKKSMGELANSLVVKANNIRTRAKGQILRDKILSTDNTWFLNDKSPVPFSLQHFTSQRGIVMDRKGRT